MLFQDLIMWSTAQHEHRIQTRSRSGHIKYKLITTTYNKLSGGLTNVKNIDHSASYYDETINESIALLWSLTNTIVYMNNPMTGWRCLRLGSISLWQYRTGLNTFTINPGWIKSDGLNVLLIVPYISNSLSTICFRQLCTVRESKCTQIYIFTHIYMLIPQLIDWFKVIFQNHTDSDKSHGSIVAKT